jgi:hypothetical protein
MVSVFARRILPGAAEGESLSKTIRGKKVRNESEKRAPQQKVQETRQEEEE